MFADVLNGHQVSEGYTDSFGSLVMLSQLFNKSKILCSTMEVGMFWNVPNADLVAFSPSLAG